MFQNVGNDERQIALCDNLFLVAEAYDAVGHLADVVVRQLYAERFETSFLCWPFQTSFQGHIRARARNVRGGVR